MQQINEAEFNLDPESWHKKALNEPIIITEKGIPKLYILSKAVFDSLYKSSRQALAISELNEIEKKALLDAEMSPEHEYLNALMEKD